MVNMGGLETYKQEIFSFLRTVTIKFEPFAYIMGETIMTQNGFTDPHAKWNPYYINLSGEYAQGDTPMTVYSLEDERDVPFDKNLINKYPKTASLYKIPNKEYFTLLERYPENSGLIKAIAYPNGDIESIIAKPNLSLLGYDASLLHINERENILSCLTEFLTMMRTRWYIKEYSYETLYPLSFWAMMWQFLPMVLLYRRFNNIRTPYVHPLHIWEYIKSKGIGDYRDVLTDRQSFWLYRNIDYINTNKGKNNNLIILAENLLEEVAVSLIGKDIVQSIDNTLIDGTEDTDNIGEVVPIIRDTNIVTGEDEGTESFPEFNDKLVDSDLEYENSIETVEEKKDELGNHNFNDLPIKILEFKKKPIDTSKEALMVNFFTDTLVYRLHENTCSYTCTFTDPYTRTSLTLPVQDVVLLWHYCVWKSLGVTPITIPTKFKVHLPFKKTKPNAKDISKYVYINQNTYDVSKYINVTELLNSCMWHDKVFTTVEDFTEVLISQFKKLLLMGQVYENSNSAQFRESMKSYYRDISVKEWLTLNLTSKSTFDEWKKSNEQLIVLFELYDTIKDTEAYTALGNACYDALFPVNKVENGGFMNTIENMERIYTAIRDLFIKLGSYNVAYLENTRERREYLQIYDQAWVLFSKFDYTADGFFNLVIDTADTSINKFFGDFEQILSDKQINIDVIIENEFTTMFEKMMNLCISFTEKTVWNHRGIIPTATDSKEKRIVIDLAQKINIGTFSVHKTI